MAGHSDLKIGALKEFLYDQCVETGPDDLPVDTVEAQIIENAVENVVTALLTEPAYVLRALGGEHWFTEGAWRHWSFPIAQRDDEADT